ncbi:cytochrome c peroxidase [Halomonas vilamensis]|uniref:Cytochrome c peroxidase n=1 Tax=Vreelandella vilamensis TaxID=531309 RepID=A0ABU1H247_9GAMM|nr:cytochrome c peroxidase [Halomonas vilamensis]MDR5897598.1 cytochrome c peroxidase [Halomonas vilamensis]
MSIYQQRQDLLGKLRRQLRYTAPALVLVASGGALEAMASDQSVYATSGEVPSTLLLASNHAEAQAEGEGEAQAEGEGEAQAEGEGEAQAEGEGEAQAEGEGEAEGSAEPNARTALVSRPDGYEPGYDESGDNPQSLIERGKALFNDASLSTNGLSCASCHGVDGRSGFQDTFNQPYPHQVSMGVNQFGMETVHADEMVQLCMVAPMAAEPLDWASDDLAALAAYVVHARARFAGEADGDCNVTM